MLLFRERALNSARQAMNIDVAKTSAPHAHAIRIAFTANYRGIFVRDAGREEEEKEEKRRRRRGEKKKGMVGKGRKRRRKRRTKRTNKKTQKKKK